MRIIRWWEERSRRRDDPQPAPGPPPPCDVTGQEPSTLITTPTVTSPGSAHKPTEPRLPGDEPDGVFSTLTGHEAARLRRLILDTAHRLGHPCRLSHDHLYDGGGRRLGIWHIVSACQYAPSDTWPTIVHHHVRDLVTPDAADTLTSQAVAESLKLRLMTDAAVADASRLPHCAPVAPGLVEVVSLDLPDRVVLPQWSALSMYGTREGMVHQARANLATQASHATSALSATSSGVPVATLTGDAFYTASLALVVDHLAPRLFAPGTYRRVDGWLVCPPAHHVLFVAPSVPDQDAHTICTLRSLASDRRQAGDIMPGEVYVVRSGRWTVAYP